MCMHTGREGRTMTGLYGRESSPSGEPCRGSGVSLTRHSLPLPSIPAVDMQKKSAHLWWTDCFWTTRPILRTNEIS